MDTLEEVQNQIKVLNNEIKETLVDIREYLLTYAQNPFASDSGQQSAPRAATPAPGSQPPAPPVAGFSVQAPSTATGPASGPPNAAPAPASPSYQGQPAPAGMGQAMSSVLGETVLHELLASRAPRNEDAAPTSKATPEPTSKAAAEQKERSKTPRSEEDETAKPKGQARSSQKEPGPSAPSGRNGVRKGRPEPVSRHSDEDASDENDPAFGEEGEPTPLAQEQPSVDMVTLAMLAPWVEDGIQRIGRHRLKGVVKTYAATGNLSEEHKDVIFQLINLDSNETAPTVVSLKDSLVVLAELDNLMVRSRLDKTGTAMLAVYLNRRGGPR